MKRVGSGTKKLVERTHDEIARSSKTPAKKAKKPRAPVVDDRTQFERAAAKTGAVLMASKHDANTQVAKTFEAIAQFVDANGGGNVSDVLAD